MTDKGIACGLTVYDLMCVITIISLIPPHLYQNTPTNNDELAAHLFLLNIGDMRRIDILQKREKMYTLLYKMRFSK